MFQIGTRKDPLEAGKICCPSHKERGIPSELEPTTHAEGPQEEPWGLLQQEQLCEMPQMLPFHQLTEHLQDMEPKVDETLHKS